MTFAQNNGWECGYHVIQTVIDFYDPRVSCRKYVDTKTNRLTHSETKPYDLVSKYLFLNAPSPKVERVVGNESGQILYYQPVRPSDTNYDRIYHLQNLDNY
jgi:hypothetical protein